MGYCEIIFEILKILVACVGAIVAFWGATIAYKKWKQDTIFQRKSQIREIMRRLHDNAESNRIIHDIDYNGWKYSKEFHKSPEEPNLDRVLQDFNYICHLYRTGEISESEFVLVKYEINRFLQNNHLKNYLYNVYHFSKSSTNVESPFDDLIEYGKSCNQIPSEFFDPNYNDKNAVFTKNLNW